MKCGTARQDEWCARQCLQACSSHAWVGGALSPHRTRSKHVRKCVKARHRAVQGCNRSSTASCSPVLQISLQIGRSFRSCFEGVKPAKCRRSADTPPRRRRPGHRTPALPSPVPPHGPAGGHTSPRWAPGRGNPKKGVGILLLLIDFPNTHCRYPRSART